MGMLLQRLDYSIFTTKMAEEALEIMRFAVPALVLTEISLPKMGGIEFLRQIKQNPKTTSVPVIVYSSSADPSLKDICKREGCTAYLSKPVDPDELYAAVQKGTEAAPRQYLRLNTCLSVVLGDENVLRSDCVMALSENGIYVSTSTLWPVEAELPITIFLDTAKVRIQGTVLYSFDRGNGPLGTSGMGIKFMRIKPEDKNLINAFIKKELTHGLVRSENGK
jgi:CheY-like chemotaxis protein